MHDTQDGQADFRGRLSIYLPTTRGFFTHHSPFQNALQYHQR